MRYFHIKNWEEFQHYKDRNPPWIKLHVSLLASETWVMLDNASRVLAIACMMLASKKNGNIPDNPDYIKRVCYLNEIPNFNPLIDVGFLELVLADASTMLADARPETETETETEKKEEEISNEQTVIGNSTESFEGNPKSKRAKKNYPEKEIELPDWCPKKDWDDFVEFRKTGKHPMTYRAKELAISELEKLRKGGNAPDKVLQQSIFRGWEGLLPIRTDYQNLPQKKTNTTNPHRIVL